MTNIVTDREGIDWMDGVSALDFAYYPLLRHDIKESDLSLYNLPPFYRLLSDTTATALANWASKANIARDALGHYWAADFNSDGKLKRNRLSWEIGQNEPKARPQFITNLSSGRPMKGVVLSDGKGDEPATPAETAISEDTSRQHKKVILLHDCKDDERILELQCEIEQLQSSLRMAERKHAGLRAQMDQMQSAYGVRSEVLTNAIVSYYFAHTSIRLLDPAISELVDESLSQEDISLAAGGVATLDHRVKVVTEIAKRLSIPVTISPEILGADDSLE